ncbi:MAG: serine/threonine protein kinase [Planctomycetes bacterium]|nr:serine/threonine protein kinase [Planctomycetota bacterium]
MTDPERIDRYQVLERLGKGSMGVLYKGRDSETGQLVAIKVLAEELLSNARAVERFKREIRSSIQLEHPNLVQALAAGQYEGKYFYVMEYVEGTTVKRELRAKGPFETRKATSIVVQIARALDYAGQFGLVHRDIKPENILLATSGTAKLADMGLAKSAASQNKLTLMGSVLGTPHYMSPEQARGEEDVDLRSDIYSLGATLYHMLAGRPPFDGTDAVAVISRLLQSEPEPLRDVNPRISDRVSMVVAKMMAKNRDARYGEARQLLADLDLLDRNASTRAEREPVHRLASPTPARDYRFLYCHIPSRHDVLLGRTLTAGGVLSFESLEEALDRQELYGMAGIDIPLGDLLLDMGLVTPAQKTKADAGLVGHLVQSGLETYVRAAVKSDFVSTQKMAEYRRVQQQTGKSIGQVLLESEDFTAEQRSIIRRIQRQIANVEEDRQFLKTAVDHHFITAGQSERALVMQNNKALQGDVQEVGYILMAKKILADEHRRTLLRAVRRHHLTGKPLADLVLERRIEAESATVVFEDPTADPDEDS